MDTKQQSQVQRMNIIEFTFHVERRVKVNLLFERR